MVFMARILEQIQVNHLNRADNYESSSRPLSVMSELDLICSLLISLLNRFKLHPHFRSTHLCYCDALVKFAD